MPHLHQWIAAWTLKPLTVAQIASLVAMYPNTFPGGQPVDLGCWFGLFSGLPCGANFMTAEILDGGADGIAVLELTIGWSDGTFVRLQFSNTISPPTANCIANLTFNAGATGTNLGYSSGGNPPCDFLELYYQSSWSSVVLTMQP